MLAGFCLCILIVKINVQLNRAMILRVFSHVAGERSPVMVNAADHLADQPVVPGGPDMAAGFSLNDPLIVFGNALFVVGFKFTDNISQGSRLNKLQLRAPKGILNVYAFVFGMIQLSQATAHDFRILSASIYRNMWRRRPRRWPGVSRRRSAILLH